MGKGEKMKGVDEMMEAVKQLVDGARKLQDEVSEMAGGQQKQTVAIETKVTVGDLAEAVAASEDPLGVIEAIDAAVADCSFTRHIYEWAKSEIEKECPQD